MSDLTNEIRKLCKELAVEKESDAKWLGYECGFSTKQHRYTIKIDRDRDYERNCAEMEEKQ